MVERGGRNRKKGLTVGRGGGGFAQNDKKNSKGSTDATSLSEVLTPPSVRDWTLNWAFAAFPDSMVGWGYCPARRCSQTKTLGRQCEDLIESVV